MTELEEAWEAYNVAAERVLDVVFWGRHKQLWEARQAFIAATDRVMDAEEQAEKRDVPEGEGAAAGDGPAQSVGYAGAVSAVAYAAS